MKSILQKIFFLVFSFSLLSLGFAKAQDESDTDDGKAKVYFYCNSSVPIQKYRFFYVDNKLAAKVHEKNFVVKGFTPGEHKFFVHKAKQKVPRTPEKEFIFKKLEAGKSYYFLALNGNLTLSNTVDCVLIEVTQKFAQEYLTNFTERDENEN